MMVYLVTASILIKIVNIFDGVYRGYKSIQICLLYTSDAADE